jgi:hypothetical protein
VIVALVLATLVAAAPQGTPTETHVRFTVSVEEAKAHLLVVRELYAAGNPGEAALHASHPVQEIGGRITGPITRADPALGARLKDALRAPRRDVDARVPRAALEHTVEATVAALDEAVARVVPADVRATLVFRTAVLRSLLNAMVKEYDEGEKNGRITQLVEYHDAYGYFRRSQALYQELAPALKEASPRQAALADERLATLARALPGLAPPATVVQTAAMKETVAGLVQALIPGRAG